MHVIRILAFIFLSTLFGDAILDLESMLVIFILLLIFLAIFSILGLDLELMHVIRILAFIFLSTPFRDAFIDRVNIVRVFSIEVDLSLDINFNCLIQVLNFLCSIQSNSNFTKVEVLISIISSIVNLLHEQL